VCRQNYRYKAQSAGAWVENDSVEAKPVASADNDLSYWTELGMCYQPEWFPLGGTLPACE
jgi:hypothetical protein